MKLAAIDIGSNAVRLMLSAVQEKNGSPTIVKESLLRVPLRLGEDVFTHQRITSEKAKSLATVIEGFKHLIAAYHADAYIACATSAMREARNGKILAAQIHDKTGIKIEIIDGRKEAAIIYAAHDSFPITKKSSLLYIDVGGGSTELTLMSHDNVVCSESFKIGTVRMLEKGKSERELNHMKKWLKEHVVPLKPNSAVGTGGSINSMFKLSRKKAGKPISYKFLKLIRAYLATYTVEERIKLLSLRPDRADVIVGAADVYLSVMKWSGTTQMYVPFMGLSDGLVRVLYDRLRVKK